ncbi:MAG: bifunctional phosphopantothenoylcysteine decarboxylase/phosphopantothenate--cysteine ligase CoaBC [Longimicrobiales bacterium]
MAAVGSEPQGLGLRDPRAPWKGKRVVLGICGGIAAYKVIQVARDLTLLGATVDVILTEAAQEFVTTLSFEGVTGRRPVTGLFSAEGAALHVVLGKEADAICVAPATADFMSRAASGRADDLLTTVLLATEAPVVVAPSMNDQMFAHPQTQSNLKHLTDELEYQVVGPVTGKLAVGEGKGPGRLVDPAHIVEAVGRALTDGSRLAGKTVLISAGPTREPLDPVRYLGNRSSGKMGYALAVAAWRRGANVTVVSGPVTVEPPLEVDLVSVETASEMRNQMLSLVPEADVVIHAAAVSDYRPAQPHPSKLKKDRAGQELEIALTANADIAADAKSLMKAGSVAVGFALETDDLIANATAKLAKKGFDLIVANQAGVPGAGFESDTNKVVILSRSDSAVDVPLSSKPEVASHVLDAVEAHLAPPSTSAPSPS